jgi:hypothetical protein
MKTAMKPVATLTLGVAIACSAAVAFAQTPQPGAAKPARQAKVDSNGDGVIDRAEAAANPRMAQHFETLDANKDGRITADERPQRGMREGKGGGQRGQRMAQLDTDKDGRFSRDELAGRQRALQNFATIDTNADGFLTREEMAAHHKAYRGERAAKPQPK